MAFNSVQYLIFLALVVALYPLLRRRGQNVLLLLASYFFYGAWDWRFLSLLWISTATDFYVGRAMGHHDNDRTRRRLLLVSIVVNLGMLGVFKYYDFFTNSAAALMEAVGLGADWPTLHVLLPVGISFYTFQTMSYTIDVYRRRIEPTRDPLAFAVFVAFFPQLVAGPIERARHLLPQFGVRRRVARGNDLATALHLIGLGLFKKVVIADAVAPHVDKAFAGADSAGWITLVVGVVGFALQIYGDFSGYSHIARGSARLLGIDLMVNFNQPYLSRNITHFWRTWHISLSTWLRDYLYIPLGGNRGLEVGDVSQPDVDHAARRPVARGGVDVRRLGRIARALPGSTPPIPEQHHRRRAGHAPNTRPTRRPRHLCGGDVRLGVLPSGHFHRGVGVPRRDREPPPRACRAHRGVDRCPGARGRHRHRSGTEEGAAPRGSHDLAPSGTGIRVRVGGDRLHRVLRQCSRPLSLLPILMRRLIVPLIVLAMVTGAELAARKVENRVPEPLTWDTQFSQDKATQLAHWGNRLDVVFTGSSVAQANFDPALFAELSPGITDGYNAGLPSMTPTVWRQFLLDTVYQEHCPSLLIVGVDIRQFSDNKPGAHDQLSRYLNARGRLDAIGGDNIWDNAETWLESHLALFRIRARLREPDKVVAWVWDIGDIGDWRNTNLSPEGRYTSNDNRTYEPSQERIENLRNGAFLDLAFGGRETTALRGIIDDAEERGVKVVLIEMPTMADQLAKALPHGAEDQKWFTEVLAGVADEYGVPLLRFPEMDNQAVYYSDDYHMNWTGIKTITTLLAERVNALDLDIAPGVCED